MQLKDLAKLCNVSQSTVSRVLNGYQGTFSVKPEVRERIRRIANEVGYNPNPVYRALRAKKNNLVMTLFPGTDDHFSGGPSREAIYRMSAIFFQHGYGFSSFYSPVDANSRLESYYQAPFIKAGGYVLPDVAMPTQLRYLKEIDVPMVVINGTAEGRPWDTINSDEEANMRLVMEYLCRRGHRRIAYINTYVNEPPHYSIAARHDSYLKCCVENGIEPLPGSELRTDDYDQQVDRIIALKATAVIAYNHYVGCNFIHQAWERHIRVPDDVSVIAFNDYDLLNFMIPALTCLKPAGERIGERAAEIMMARISGAPELPPAPLFEKYPGSILERESVRSI